MAELEQDWLEKIKAYLAGEQGAERSTAEIQEPLPLNMNNLTNVEPMSAPQPDVQASFNSFMGEKAPAAPITDGGISDAMLQYLDRTKQTPVPEVPVMPGASQSRSSASTKSFSGPSSPAISGPKGNLPGLAAESSSLDALKAAQHDSDINDTNALLMRAGERIGAGLARQKPDYGFSDQMLKMAGKPVDQYKEQEASKMSDTKLREARQQMEDQKYRKDPESTLNQMMRGVFKKMGVNVPANATIDGMKEIIPAIDTMFRSEMMKEMHADKIAAAKEKSGVGLTPGEKMRDQMAAKTVEKWVDQGQRNMVRSDIESLKEVERALENGDFSGPVRGRIPGQSLLNSEGYKLQQKVQGVTQKNLREILGGQFAQKEGEQVMKRAYDEVVDGKENLERVRKLRMAMEEAADAKDATVNYFSQKGTMKGLKPETDIQRSPDQQTFPRQVRNGGKVATVSNEQELADANSKGFH